MKVVEGIPLMVVHSLVSEHVLPSAPLEVEGILLLVVGRKKASHTHILQVHLLNGILLLLVEDIPCWEHVGFYDEKPLCLQALD